MTGLPQVTAVDTWESSAEKYLPQPVADGSISSEMSKLKSMVNNHVVSYYRASEIDLDAIDETTLAGLIEASQLSVSQMTSAITARTTLLSKWRTITASMLEQTYGSKTITESDPRSYNIGHALEELDSVLIRLRARRDENASRRQNLEEILKCAAGFAFLLFSHPSSWKFEWRTGLSHEPGYAVIFPALLQVTDEKGERLSRPRPFEEVETARLIT
ncbi:hypothetical protein SLS58_003646 [Diplodia intermedia]|uniref:Uncharacterized protein n=1 Tax=Diplodia intermedia TaxID=856260 RepID=A0ABR3TWL7_9PEZI